MPVVVTTPPKIGDVFNGWDQTYGYDCYKVVDEEREEIAV